MTVITAGETDVHELFGVRFRGLASPSKGSTELMAWQTEVPPGTPATPHQLTREELVVILSGRGRADLDGTSTDVGPGDVVVVPPDTDFAIVNAGDETLRLLAVMPTSGQARIDGEAMTLPWMQ
jgi:mannose-6-phosphate isomerase-like protein (cupin superfamily)